MTQPCATPVTPRARGTLRLAVKHTSRGTVLRDLRQAGSAKLVFPNTESPALQAVMVNTAGGITGGDRFDVSVRAAPNTHLTLTTQTAERAYGAQLGETGRLVTDITVDAGARIDWVPQETILFNTCRFARTLRIDLATDARLLFVEPLVFGRAAMGEILTDIVFHDRVDIWRDGAPLFIDAVQITGDAHAQMNGHGALASVVYVAPDAGAHIDTLRAHLPDTAGASLIGDDLLHLRFLASDSFELRRALVPVLNALTHHSLPRAWMI